VQFIGSGVACASHGCTYVALTRRAAFLPAASIWYGTPQWQIDAFRRFEIPKALIEAHGYQPLTRQVKEQIFGLNAARLFNVDVAAKRNEIPKDYLSQIKMAYLEGGPAPTHRFYGWTA